eukprot:scaffold363_cov216-Skeletonema_marinoi.AAC.9
MAVVLETAEETETETATARPSITIKQSFLLKLKRWSWSLVDRLGDKGTCRDDLTKNLTKYGAAAMNSRNATDFGP